MESMLQPNITPEAKAAGSRHSLLFPHYSGWIFTPSPSADWLGRKLRHLGGRALAHTALRAGLGADWGCRRLYDKDGVLAQGRRRRPESARER